MKWVAIYLIMILTSCHSDPKSVAMPMAEQRIAVFVAKTKVILDCVNNPTIKNKEKSIKFLEGDLIAEINSLDNWFSDPFLMIVGTKKDSAGLPESELCARVRGKVSEMRLALDGYAETLPNDSTLSQRIKVINKLAHDCQKLTGPTA